MGPSWVQMAWPSIGSAGWEYRRLSWAGLQAWFQVAKIPPFNRILKKSLPAKDWRTASFCEATGIFHQLRSDLKVDSWWLAVVFPWLALIFYSHRRHAHGDDVASINPWDSSSLHSWVAICWCSGFMPGWLAFVGLMSSFFLNGREMKNFSFFHRGFGHLLRNSEWESWFLDQLLLEVLEGIIHQMEVIRDWFPLSKVLFVG